MSTEPNLPSIYESSAAKFVRIIAILEFGVAPVAGYIISSKWSQDLGITICIGGILNAAFFLVLAEAVEFLSESTQRLKRIEIILRGGNQDKG